MDLASSLAQEPRAKELLVLAVHKIGLIPKRGYTHEVVGIILNFLTKLY